jgi:hypothetical protein
MAISEATATLMSGGLSTGSSLIAGILNYYANERANKQNLGIYKEQRKDSLAAQKLAQKNFERQQGFSESESQLNRQEGLEQKGYSRLQQSYQRGAELLTRQMNMNQISAAPFQKYAGTK